MPDTNRRVQTIIDDFVRQLTQVAREEAARVVLGGVGAAVRGRGASSGAGRGAKRSTEDLAQLEDRVVAFVAKHPGLRIEQINAEMGTSTAQLALPIRKLVAAKRLRTAGQRRSTKYFVVGASGAGTRAPVSKRAKK